MAWSPDGKKIASGSGDSTIKIWDSQSGECQSTLRGHSRDNMGCTCHLRAGDDEDEYYEAVNSVAWSPDGKQIASGSDDETIKIWDSQSGECQWTLRGQSDR